MIGNETEAIFLTQKELARSTRVYFCSMTGVTDEKGDS